MTLTMIQTVLLAVEWFITTKSSEILFERCVIANPLSWCLRLQSRHNLSRNELSPRKILRIRVKIKLFYSISTWFYFPVNWMIYFLHNIYVPTSNRCLAVGRGLSTVETPPTHGIQLCTNIVASLLPSRNARKFWKISSRLATAKTSWWMLGKQGWGEHSQD